MYLMSRKTKIEKLISLHISTDAQKKALVKYPKAQIKTDFETN